MTLALRYAIRSDVGLLREGNEDSAYAGPRLLAVADGMGGHAAGEVASAAAITAIAKLDDDVPGSDLLDALADAVHDANHALHDMVAKDPAIEGMGTTLTAMLWSGSRSPESSSCGATSSTRSRTISRWSRRWSTRGGSAPMMTPPTRSARCCCGPWMAGPTSSLTCRCAR